MSQVIQASNLSLYEVEEKFNLQQVQEPQFFPEWQGDLPNLTDCEKRWLDSVKADFLGLAKFGLHEEIVKLVVLAPLLSLAGLCRLPFQPTAEKQVEIAFEDKNEIVRGRIDVLFLHRRLWATLIESKRKSINVSEALPQALFYMLSSPNGDKPTFGFAINGSEFLFIKFIQQEQPLYALSKLFSLINPGNDLYEVLGVLRRLRELVLEQRA